MTFVVLYAGFIFLRDSNAPKGLSAIVAIVWGVGGVAVLYFVSNWFVENAWAISGASACSRSSSSARRSPS